MREPHSANEQNVFRESSRKFSGDCQIKENNSINPMFMGNLRWGIKTFYSHILRVFTTNV